VQPINNPSLLLCRHIGCLLSGCSCDVQLAKWQGVLHQGVIATCTLSRNPAGKRWITAQVLLQRGSARLSPTPSRHSTYLHFLLVALAGGWSVGDAYGYCSGSDQECMYPCSGGTWAAQLTSQPARSTRPQAAAQAVT
jgi:hypothetical protein